MSGTFLEVYYIIIFPLLQAEIRIEIFQVMEENEVSDELFSTPLLGRHLGLGARMVPFGGWNMPVQYGEGILAEHKHCREHAALFDICHMGEFRVQGSQSAADLDRILARPVLNQAIGTCRYNFLLNEQGGVMDDLIVYRLAEQEFYIVVNAGPRAGDAAWLQKHLSPGTSFCDESDATAKLDLQGPEAAEVLMRLGVAKDALPAYYHWQKINFQGVPVLLSRTGYTGELGYELYFPAEKAEDLWDILLQDGSVKPAGLGARDTLRLEMGYPLYGHEMDKATTPVEAGFGALLKLEQPRNFIGSEVLRDAVQVKAKRQLLGFRLETKRAARHGSAILYQGKEVGVITSGAVAPSLDVAVAMGYVQAELNLQPGDHVELDIGKVRLGASVSSLPFYQQGSVRNHI